MVHGHAGASVAKDEVILAMPTRGREYSARGWLRRPPPIRAIFAMVEQCASSLHPTLLSAVLLVPSAGMAKQDLGLQNVRTILAATLEKRQDTGDISRVRDLEPAMILAAGGRADRKGGTLTLRFSNGNSRAYITKGDCETLLGMCQAYALIAFVGTANLFMVSERFYERIGCLIVDSRTGHETELPDIPYLGPDGDRFLVVSGTDGGGAYWPIQIWRRRGDRAFVEWKQTDRPPNFDVAVTAAEWTRHDRIDLTMVSVSRRHAPPAGFAPTRWAATLTFTDGRWSMKTLTEH
jgi:hypothetical protein